MDSEKEREREVLPPATAAGTATVTTTGTIGTTPASFKPTIVPSLPKQVSEDFLTAFALGSRLGYDCVVSK